MDFNALSLNDLKALAYDQLASLEQTQNNLRIVNAEIEKRIRALTPIEAPPAEATSGL